MDINEIIRDYKLFVDTCSIMHEKSPDFFYSLAPILIETEKKLIIPDKVTKEIERLQNSSNSATQNAAKSGATILKHYIDYNLLDIRGEKNDPFADNVFHYVFSKFRTQYDLALITQDKELAMDILLLKSSKAIKSSKKLLVLKIGKRGDILTWRKDRPRQDSNFNHNATNATFRSFKTPRSQKDKIIIAQSIPGVGDEIITDNFRKIRLLNIIGEGGEGKIFDTDSDFACKVYFKDRLTENRFLKLSLMTKRKIQIPGVCWPLSLVRNSSNDFVGYLMPRAEGNPMQKCMFVKPLLENNFPNWTRHNLAQLAISWLEKVVALHKNNILIGDINPLNILIKSDREIYFVDTDSYQIEDFPCPVGMANFTAPEIQGVNFSTFLRTFEHEYFAIATLLFMVLLPGKPPYSHQGGGDPIKNITKGQFSYPLGDKSSQKTPDGPWRFIWSHLPFKTKKAFYDCFSNQMRMNPEKWLDLMRGYKFALENGYLDPEGESEKLFPTRFKRISEFAKEKYGAEDGDWEIFKCDSCGNQFQLSSHQSEKMKRIPKKICRNCYQIQKLENTTGETMTCVDCGNRFLFTIREQKFFDSKCLSYPKRCKSCRDNRKHSKSSPSSFYNTSNQQSQTYRDYTPKTNHNVNQQYDSIWDIFKDIWKTIFD